TYTRGGTERTVKVDELLLADDRIPATDLGLENAGVKYNHHAIVVDQHLQTSARHIFAAGSCVHVNSSTHDILMQSRTAASNLLHSKLTAIEPHIPLQVTRTHPGIARVGLSEDDCIRRDRRVKIA